MLDFRLNNDIPFNIVSEISIPPKLMVLLQKFLAVHECSVVVPNNLAQGREIPFLGLRQSAGANKSKRLLSPCRFGVLDDAFNISQVFSKILYIVPKFLVLPG